MYSVNFNFLATKSDGRIAMMLSKKLSISPLRALDVFYTSKVCDRLHAPETEFYTFSDAYIVDEIIMEIRNRNL